MFKAIAATAATLGAAASVVTAATASADEYDYLDFLDSKGVPYGSSSEAIDEGKWACSNLRRGIGVPITEQFIQASGYAFIEARIIMGGAVFYMCPDVTPIIENYMAGNSSPG